MKAAILATISLVLLFLLFQTYTFYVRSRTALREEAELQKRLEKERQTASGLAADYEFYQDPDNLEKELRSKFNYKSPGEKIIVIVQPRTATSSTTAP